MRKLYCGRYHVRIVPITDDASAMAPDEITERYMRLLEDNICRQPSIWLWTHRRRKHKLEMPGSAE